MLDKAYDRPVKIWEDYGYQKQTMLVFMESDQWSKARKFAVVRELKQEEDRITTQCWCTTYSYYSKWIKFQQASIVSGYWHSD